MSRSKRKTPICGMTLARSEKQDKKLWHRKFRRKAKIDPDIQVRDVSDPWKMDKDGKQVLDKETIKRNPKLMRK